MTESHQIERIVVGVDGSYYSKFALRWAAYMADLLGTGIEAMLVWQTPMLHSREWTSMAPREELRADMDKALTEAVDEVFGANRPPHLRLLVQEGAPANVLVERSKHAAMLIVGSRGHGGFANMLLGAVSTKCVQHACCPVLVIHGNEPPARPEQLVAEQLVAEQLAAEQLAAQQLVAEELAADKLAPEQFVS